MLNQEQIATMTCSDFIMLYCELYKLDLRPINHNYHKGPDAHSFKFLVYILRINYNLSFRIIGKLLYRVHQDIAHHYKTMMLTDFYRQQARERFANVRSVYEIRHG